MRRALLIYNPAAGRRRHQRWLPGLLERLSPSFTVEPIATGAPGDATRICRDLAAGRGAPQAEVAFILGGDGTVREAAVGLMGSEIVLGILPGGTANVLARALGLPADPLAAAALLGSLPTRSMDVGLCGGTPFLMMASSGLDATALGEVDLGLKASLGPAGVFLSGVGSWWRYGYPPLELEADGEGIEATFASVCNVPLYGGPFKLAPDARFDDRRLDLVVFRGRGRLATLGFAWDVLRGGHAQRPDVAVRQVSEVVFHGPAAGCLQVDGDLCAEHLPARVTVADARLQVLAP